MKNYAHLHKDSPFYAVFENGRVPIKNWIIPNQAVCEGDGPSQEVYMVDLDRLTPEEFDRVARMVHQQCDPNSPLEVAKKEMKARGLPLRAKHVASTSSDCPAFL